MHIGFFFPSFSKPPESFVFPSKQQKFWQVKQHVCILLTAAMEYCVPALAGQYPELRGTGTRVVVNILYAEQEDNRQKGGES